MNATTAELTGSSDGPDSSRLRPMPERVATALVTFVFAINVAFLLYMVAQFFYPKPYSTSAHVAYTLIVVISTLLLAYSTRSLWTHRTKAGCYAFFAAIIFSGAANVAVDLAGM